MEPVPTALTRAGPWRRKAFEDAWMVDLREDDRRMAKRPVGGEDSGRPVRSAVSYDSPIGEDAEEVGGERTRRYTQISERSRCRFCREKVTRVDYKDVLTLQKLCTSQGRIFSRKRSGNCATHQRQVKRAVKQARYVALMSYTA